MMFSLDEMCRVEFDYYTSRRNMRRSRPSCWLETIRVYAFLTCLFYPFKCEYSGFILNKQLSVL